jgi:hypothetical protein
MFFYPNFPWGSSHVCLSFLHSSSLFCLFFVTTTATPRPVSSPLPLFVSLGRKLLASIRRGPDSCDYIISSRYFCPWEVLASTSFWLKESMPFFVVENSWRNLMNPECRLSICRGGYRSLKFHLVFIFRFSTMSLAQIQHRIRFFPIKFEYLSISKSIVSAVTL